MRLKPLVVLIVSLIGTMLLTFLALSYSYQSTLNRLHSFTCYGFITVKVESVYVLEENNNSYLIQDLQGNRDVLDKAVCKEDK